MPPSSRPLRDRTPWIRAGLAGLGGAATALSLAPLDLTPFVFGYAVLLGAIARAPTPASAAFAAWAWALGYHVVGLHWIANAMLVNAGAHAWLIPFANLGLPAILAGFTAAAGYLAHRLFGSGIALWTGFAALFVAGEWVRGHTATGFPWNLPAATLDGWLVFLQPASLVGAYGLSVGVVLVASAPTLWFDRSVARRARLGASSFALLLVLAAGGWGAARVAGVPDVDDPAGRVPGVVVRIVQGNVPQADKWNPQLKPEHLGRYLELSRGDRAGSVRSPGLAESPTPTLVIWPETAVARLLGRDPRITRSLARAAPAGGSLIFGAPRAANRNGGIVVHNSLFAVSSEAGKLWHYDKAHLVPFGEYVPLRSVLPIEPIVQSRRDFTPGPGPRTLPVQGAPPVSPLICYEVIFPGAVTDPENRPGWLLNATNDAWFGPHSGPHQHLAIARLRAIEEGLPMVRAANTGISVVIDPVGRILAQLGVEETGNIDSTLPRALPATAFSVFHDLPFSLMVVLLILISAYARSRAARGASQN